MTRLLRLAVFALIAAAPAGGLQAQAIRHGATFGAHIDLFSSTNFRGHRIRLTTSVADLRWYGFGGRVGSVRTVGRWRLCSMTNFRGHCTTVSHNRSSLGGMRVESVRFVSR